MLLVFLVSYTFMSGRLGLSGSVSLVLFGCLFKFCFCFDVFCSLVHELSRQFSNYGLTIIYLGLK